MEVANSIRLLGEAQNAIIVARSERSDGEFAISDVRMKRDEYLDLHKVNPTDIGKTIDALVAALEAIERETMRCRGEQAYRDAVKFVAKTSREALAQARSAQR